MLQDDNTPLVRPRVVHSVLLAAPSKWVLEFLAPKQQIPRREKELSQRFASTTHRDDFIAARALARECIRLAHGSNHYVNVGFTQHCTYCGSFEHGRPEPVSQPPTHLSWSHSNGYVAAIVGDGAVGVDVEFVTRITGDLLTSGGRFTDNELIAIKSSTTPEVAAARQWVFKEAIIKAESGESFSSPRTDELDAELPPRFWQIRWENLETGLIATAMSSRVVDLVRLLSPHDLEEMNYQRRKPSGPNQLKI